MAGGAGAEAGVGVCGGCGLRVGLKRHPSAGSGAGHLDSVAGDRATARRRSGPVQLDPRRSPGPGRKARRPPGQTVRRGARHVRPVPPPMPADRRDPVVARSAGRETDIPVAGGGTVRRQETPGEAAVGGRLDAVARDRRAPGVDRLPPVEVDHRRALGVRRQGAGRPGGSGVRRGGVHHGRPGPEADGVPRPDPVVPGDARGKIRVPERRQARGRQLAPGAAAGRHVHPVGDRAPAGRGRCVPVEVDDRRAVGRRRQVAGYTRCPGRRRGGVRVRPGPGAVGVPRPDPVVAGGARRETRVPKRGQARVVASSVQVPPPADTSTR